MDTESFDPMNVKAQDMADIVGISRVWLRKLTTEGVLTCHGAGKYVLTDTVKAYVEYVARGKASTERAISRNAIEDEKLRRLRIENDAADGKSIPRDDAQLAFNEAVSIIAAGMDALPGRVSAELAGMSDAGRIRQRLKDEVHGIRKEAADRLSMLGRGAPGGKAPEPTTKLGAGRVGGRASKDAEGQSRAGRLSQ